MTSEMHIGIWVMSSQEPVSAELTEACDAIGSASNLVNIFDGCRTSRK